MGKQQPREYKAVPQWFKAADDNPRTKIGIFSVFGVVDSYDDVVHPGAFTKTVQERGKKIYHLWQHSFDQPAIAVIDAISEVTQNDLPDQIRTMYPEATGAMAVTRTYLDTLRGNEILTGIDAGVEYEMSFAYDAVKYDFEESDRARWGVLRHLREVRLWETSDVLWGANDATIANLRQHPMLARLGDDLKSLIAQLEHTKTVDDADMAALETLIKTLQQSRSSCRAVETIPTLTDLKAKVELLSLSLGG